MVWSYQGERVVKPEERQSILVSDYMTRKLITFNPNQSIYEVIRALLNNKISGGPVVNDQNELIGVISEGDCLKEVIRGKYHNLPIVSGLVKDHMATNVVSISPDTNIFEAAQMFLNRRLRRFPVLRDGKLVGQISQKDVMKAVLEIKSSNWKKSKALK